MFGYVLAAALAVAMGAVRLAFANDTAAPFLLFYPAIALAAFGAGLGPGLLATFLAALFAFSFFPTAPLSYNWVMFAVLGPFFAAGFAHLRLVRDRHLAAAREMATFKFIGDHAMDWILLLDATGRIRYANLRACADLGRTDRELVGCPIESLAPESQRAGLHALLEAAKSGDAKPIEITFAGPAGAPVRMELSCTGVETADARHIHIAARDIAERRRMEQERKNIDDKLREMRHWENLGMLAGGLAHDFNNHLTSILGYASLAKDSLPPDHEAAAMLQNIVEAGEQSADLVRLLLATSGFRPRYKERLHLDQLLDRVIASRPLPRNVQVARTPAAASFHGDRHSFETLLWSLIANAAESYGRNEGVVRVTFRLGPAPHGAPRNSDVSFSEGDAGPGECLGIIVEDAGCGMPPEVLARAFDPFFSTKFPGRGLGLPAVRGLVRAYSGKLLLETAQGRGTRVEVWLPGTAEA